MMSFPSSLTKKKHGKYNCIRYKDKGHKEKLIHYKRKKMPEHYKSECLGLENKENENRKKKKFQKKSLMFIWEDLDSSSSNSKHTLVL